MNLNITATEFLKRATATAEYYGFVNRQTLKKHPEYKRAIQKLSHTASASDRKSDALYGMLTGGISAYAEEKIHAFEEPVFYYSIEQVPRSGESALTLHAFGIDKSIAEAVLIHVSQAIAEELGAKNTSVRINSLGDSDSAVRYTRELNNYFKKRFEDLPPTARELLKEHAIDTLLHLIEKGDDLAFKSPSPLEYLSDPSRKHFREIIEYLDMSETMYEIDPKLIGHHHCYSEALFAIDILDDDGVRVASQPITVRGGRYNAFMQKHTKRDVGVAGAVIILRDKKAPQRTPRIEKTTPSVYVVQLGFGPKVRSLRLINELRHAGIAVYQNIAADSLSQQLRDAEAKGVRHAVIIGQKEFMDNTVILRDLHGRSQESVAFSGITNRLKRMSTT